MSETFRWGRRDWYGRMIGRNVMAQIRLVYHKNKPPSYQVHFFRNNVGVIYAQHFDNEDAAREAYDNNVFALSTTRVQV